MYPVLKIAILKNGIYRRFQAPSVMSVERSSGRPTRALFFPPRPKLKLVLYLSIGLGLHEILLQVVPEKNN